MAEPALPRPTITGWIIGPSSFLLRAPSWLILGFNPRLFYERAQGESGAMKQVWITKVGTPESLQVREGPDPVAKNGEVRVRVQASGVNFADIMARLGLYPDAPKLPAVMGYEVSGQID